MAARHATTFYLYLKSGVTAMKTKSVLISTAVTSLIAFGAISMSAQAADDANTEKCYGVAKAGKNDCFTAKNSCAGTTTQDSGAAGVDLRAEGHVQPNRRRHHHRTERLTTEPFFTDVFINQGDSR